MLHSDNTCFGNWSDQEPLNKGLVGNLVNRDDYVKQLNDVNNQWEK